MWSHSTVKSMQSKKQNHKSHKSHWPLKCISLEILRESKMMSFQICHTAPRYLFKFQYPCACAPRSFRSRIVWRSSLATRQSESTITSGMNKTPISYSDSSGQQFRMLVVPTCSRPILMINPYWAVGWAARPCDVVVPCGIIKTLFHRTVYSRS